jgi:broad specificity phosphatase PhoE
MTRLQRLVLVRHGETVGNSSIRYFGATDVGLSDLGLWQMERVRGVLADERFDAVYTSSLQRTRVGARIIAPEVPATAIGGFDEINFGSWEGLTREEIRERDGPLFQRWTLADGNFTYPGGDTIASFRARVAETFRKLLPTAPERVLIVAHKGVIRTIVSHLSPLSSEDEAAWPIDLGSVHVLRSDGDRWHPEAVNLTHHLEEES